MKRSASDDESVPKRPKQETERQNQLLTHRGHEHEALPLRHARLSRPKATNHDKQHNSPPEDTSTHTSDSDETTPTEHGEQDSGFRDMSIGQVNETLSDACERARHVIKSHKYERVPDWFRSSPYAVTTIIALHVWRAFPVAEKAINRLNSLGWVVCNPSSQSSRSVQILADAVNHHRTEYTSALVRPFQSEDLESCRLPFSGTYHGYFFVLKFLNLEPVKPGTRLYAEQLDKLLKDLSPLFKCKSIRDFEGEKKNVLSELIAMFLEISSDHDKCRTTGDSVEFVQSVGMLDLLAYLYYDLKCIEKWLGVKAKLPQPPTLSS